MSSSDREVLVAFYRATGGPRWRKNDDWDTSNDISSWYGVTVRDGRVVKLNLGSLWESNNLQGSIPKELGQLSFLEELNLRNNKLEGSIPKELGQLSFLEELNLSRNRLEGSIPKELAQLTSLTSLKLSFNKLGGSIPKELAQLTSLTYLSLLYNKLDGDVPSSFSNLTSLKTFWCNQRAGFILSGGPIPGESMDEFRLRLKSQDQSSSTMTRIKTSTEPTMEGVDCHPVPSQSQLVLPSELLHITREDRMMFDEVRELIAKKSEEFDALPQAENLRELDLLVGMAKHLEEIVAVKVEDDNMQQREGSLVRGSMEEAHYTTLRDGLCNAYLASRVVGSKMVSTSQTGTMGTAGKVLKFISGVTPVCGGLANVAAAALKSGDNYVQTQKVVKISEMASDVLECSKIAKRVAIKITEGLTVVGTIARGARVETNTVDLSCAHLAATAGVEGTLGGLYDCVDADAVLDWFAEEVASDASDLLEQASDAVNRSKEAKEGKRYGEKHLCMILRAIGRDCLRSITDTDAKIEILAMAVLGRAAPPAGISEQAVKQNDVDTCTAEAPLVAPPPGKAVREPAQRRTASQTDVGASRGRMEAIEIVHARRIEVIERKHAENTEALKDVEAKHAEEIEALRRQGSDIRKTVASQNEVEVLRARIQAMEIEHAQKLEAREREHAQRIEAIELEHALRIQSMETTDAKHAGDIKVLMRQASSMRKKVEKLEKDRKDKETSGAIDAGGGQLFAKKQVQRETVEGFWSSVEARGNRGSMAPEEVARLQRETLEEKVEMMEGRVGRLEAASKRKQTKTSLRRRDK